MHLRDLIFDAIFRIAVECTNSEVFKYRSASQNTHTHAYTTKMPAMRRSCLAQSPLRQRLRQRVDDRQREAKTTSSCFRLTEHSFRKIQFIADTQRVQTTNEANGKYKEYIYFFGEKANCRCVETRVSKYMSVCVQV